MIRNLKLHRLLAGSMLSLSIVAIVPAQDVTDQKFVLPYNKAPETVQEFWAATKYDMSLGNYARAAQMLGSYYDKFMAFGEAEQKKYFQSIFENQGKEGYSSQLLNPLLRLSTIAEAKQVMRKDPVSGQDRPAVDILIDRATTYIDSRFSDPERIRFFVSQLNKRPEERAYAISQLRTSGARSVPAMLDVLRDPAQQSLHGPVFNALLKMDNDIAPPLLSALDSKSEFVKGTILDVLTQRADARIVPDLYYLSQASSSTPALKEKAKEWLKRFLNKDEKEWNDARAELVKTAEKYHQHQVDLNGQRHHVWTWNDQTGLTGQPASASQVEESRGIAYARKALDLDARYRPAQVALLSLALDKLYERGGSSVDVSKANPDLHALLAGAPADLLEEVLAKALRDRNSNAALGAIKALGAHGDPALLRQTEQGLPALLKALQYPDRRIKFAAAEAALANNNKGEPFVGSSQVVEVLRHAATSSGQGRILIGMGNREEADRLAEQLKLLKYDVKVVGSGKQLLNEAASHGSVALIITDATLPDPGFGYFLTQYKNHHQTAGVPLLVIADKDAARQAQDALPANTQLKILASAPQSGPLLDTEVKELIGTKNKAALTDAERSVQAKAAISLLAKIARGDVTGFDLKPADTALMNALNDETLSTNAGAALAHRPTRDAQQALAGAVVNEALSPTLRASLAPSLRAHLHRFGNHMSNDQVKNLSALALSATDPSLREQADLTVSSLRKDASVIGNRLKGYVPSATPPATKVEPGKDSN